MKKLVYLFTAATLVLSSCSKDDPAPKTEAQLTTESLISQVPKVNAPSKLGNTSSQEANSYSAIATSFSQIPEQILSIVPPAGTQSSNEPVAASGSQRTAPGDYLSYYWSDAGYDFAYQLFEGDTQYIIDLYYKSADTQDTYVPFLHVEADKDGKNGFYESYAAYNEGGEVTTVFTFTFTWTSQDNGAVRYQYDLDGMAYYDLLINPDSSGTLAISQFDELLYESAWDAAGSGWWKYYDYEGNVTEGSF